MPKPAAVSGSEGIMGKPTTINNVETLANVRHIFEKALNGLHPSAPKTAKERRSLPLPGRSKIPVWSKSPWA
jgi:NADH:ubiquinone oxidoreductase subunit F (NADH-binding)